MSTPGDRLRKARRAAGYGTATDFAAALGINRNTYLQHENGTRAFDAEVAELYARRAKTTPEHLLYGRTAPTQAALKEIAGYAGADPEGTVAFAAGQGTGDFAPVPPGASDDAMAVEIRGYSMPFFAEDGALVWIDGIVKSPDAEMIGQVIVCQLETDEVLIKRLQRGTVRGRWNLVSLAGPIRENVSITWAGRITMIIPPLEARRIIQRSGLAA